MAIRIFICVTLSFILYSCYSKPIYRAGGRYYQIGIASYYADEFHGRKTSSGETFDMYDLTAAHNSLPLGTVAKIHNLENGKTVVVKINDRGPFKKGRILDLSLGAAKKIDADKKGTARIAIEIIKLGDGKK